MLTYGLKVLEDAEDKLRELGNIRGFADIFVSVFCRDVIAQEIEMTVALERDLCCQDVCVYCRLKHLLLTQPCGESWVFVHKASPNSIAFPCAATSIRLRWKKWEDSL